MCIRDSSKGVIRYNPKSGKVSALERTGVYEQLCFYTYYDAQRRLIWGGGMGSFAIWDEEGKVQRTVTQYKDVTIQGNILSITRDSVGSYWLGGREIYRYDYDTGALVRYANERGAPYFCMEMATDAYGTTWFATDMGLCYYDAKPVSYTHLDVYKRQLRQSTDQLGCLELYRLEKA